MPIYALRCPAGHGAQVRQPYAAPLPPCPDCGAPTAKVPAGFALSGRAGVPPAPEALPQTWKGTYGANREYLAQLRRTAEARRQLEERHPELAGDRRPVLAHEGRYAARPLRAGDPGAASGPAGPPPGRAAAGTAGGPPPGAATGPAGPPPGAAAGTAGGP